MSNEMFKTVEIDGEEYVLQHASPSQAWKTTIKLTKMIAEPFVSMAKTAGDDDAAADALPMAIKALMNNIGEEDSLKLILEIMAPVEHKKSSTVFNSQKAFDIHFKGKMGHMLRVLIASTEFQFSDFIAAIGDGVANLMNRKPA